MVTWYVLFKLNQNSILVVKFIYRLKSGSTFPYLSEYESHSVVSDSLWSHNHSLWSNLPGSSMHGILQARILKWAAVSFSRQCCWPSRWTRVSCIAGRFFTIWATCTVNHLHYFLFILTVKMIWEDNLFTVWILSMESYLEYMFWPGIVVFVVYFRIVLPNGWIWHFKTSRQRS